MDGAPSVLHLQSHPWTIQGDTFSISAVFLSIR
eukprot:SAG31_NODE_9608_length_1251_cov_1.282986_2_plen_32_part_01